MQKEKQVYDQYTGPVRAESATKHTLGPWRSGDMFNTVFGPPNGKPCPEIIATIHKGNRANARLISAAPELLAALYKLLPLVDDCEDFEREHLEAIPDNPYLLHIAALRTQAENVIKKALGE